MPESSACELSAHLDAQDDGRLLENYCPIQAHFPAYAALAPTDFDLQAFEAEAARCDAQAAASGHASTTVAGAIALFPAARTNP